MSNEDLNKYKIKNKKLFLLLEGYNPCDTVKKFYSITYASREEGYIYFGSMRRYKRIEVIAGDADYPVNKIRVRFNRTPLDFGAFLELILLLKGSTDKTLESLIGYENHTALKTSKRDFSFTTSEDIVLSNGEVVPTSANMIIAQYPNLDELYEGLVGDAMFKRVECSYQLPLIALIEDLTKYNNFLTKLKGKAYDRVLKRS